MNAKAKTRRQSKQTRSPRSAALREGPVDETVGEKLEYLYPEVLSGPIPRWPPDVFCLCASLLQRSGAYAVVVDDNPPHVKGTDSVKRAKQIERIGKEWRTACVSESALPRDLHRWWNVIIRNKNLPIQKLRTNQACAVALLNLLGAADAASHSIGIFSFEYEDATHCPYSKMADIQLLQTGVDKKLGATLCRGIHPSKARVLPKMHTPQNGLTIRSMSHHLAYCQAPGVYPAWWSSADAQSPHTFNLLIIPWPDRTSPRQFRDVSRSPLPDRLDPEHYGLFTYDQVPGPSPAKVLRLIEAAEKKVGKIDGVVFPELAMTEKEFDRLSARIVTPSRLLISGVGSSAERTRSGSNQALMDIAHRLSKNIVVRGRLRQDKHHRWKITKSQIVQYGIGASLHPEASWWESISVRPRSIAFATVRQWLTLSVLICEDLARPDPVGDILRAVGPNLIIALLADGPQISSRWPGRYAAAFADDPGSSVLTITSAGMSRLSKAESGTQDRSGIVSMWRDPFSGVRELELPSNANALVLNLTVKYDREWTADGRDDDGWSGYPILAGCHAISDEKPKPTKSKPPKLKAGVK